MGTTPSSPDSAARGSTSLSASAATRSARTSRRALPVPAVAVQRDRAADRIEGSKALVAVLDEEFLIEQTPPDHDRFTGEFGIDLVGDAGHGQTAVEADQSTFGLAREGAEALPRAH